MTSKAKQMKVGFYDTKTRSMVDVEPWSQGIDFARSTSAVMAQSYQSGRHRMPSHIWCVWDGGEHASIFFLDGKPSTDVAFTSSILSIMK